MGGLLEEDHQEWLSGWAATHDYDPSWDYQVRFDLRHHRLALLAQSTAEKICADYQLPWIQARVYPADLEGPLAIYASGTSGAPVVVVDLESHHRAWQEVGLDARSLEIAVVDSVLHELRHAYQEAHEWPLDEDEAEHGSERIPF
jgi:hypothetical protein